MNNNKARRVITQPFDFSVQDLVNKIKNKEIKVDPEYQRKYVWNANDDKENKKSRLIESLLLNIPIPVIYFAETTTLQYEVIDGQQRLRTFDMFLKDDFSLENLEYRGDLNGKKYSELESNDQDLIRKRAIRAIVVLNDSDEDIKFMIFERLNLGSVQLSSQEIRNNIYRGSFNNLLKELANTPTFRKLLKLRLEKDKENMAYEEMVLRFFAYHHLGEKKRSELLELFLTEYMSDNKDINEEKICEFRRLFNETIEKIDKYLGEKAFSICTSKAQNWNATSNRRVFDAEMLAFSQIKESDIRITPKVFQQQLKNLMITDKKFQKSLNTDGTRMLEDRVETVRKILTSK